MGPRSPDAVPTYRSLGYCIFSPTIEEALEQGVREEASCIYAVGCEAGELEPQPRAGTNGCKIPESVFGGMKSYTDAVAGDHDGVGSLQTNLQIVQAAATEIVQMSPRGTMTAGPDHHTGVDYPLSEDARALLNFLPDAERAGFVHRSRGSLGRTLDALWSLAREAPSAPYGGQPLANAPGGGRSKLVTVRAVRATNLQALHTTGSNEVPADLVKLAVLQEMSPYPLSRPVRFHYFAPEAGVTGPLVDFLQEAGRRVGWQGEAHADWAALTAVVQAEAGDRPPYFLAAPPGGDKQQLDAAFLSAVAGRMGYLYASLSPDPLRALRQLTTTQAWTAAVDEPGSPPPRRSSRSSGRPAG